VLVLLLLLAALSEDLDELEELDESEELDDVDEPDESEEPDESDVESFEEPLEDDAAEAPFFDPRLSFL
jgi:hypothetical protein